MQQMITHQPAALIILQFARTKAREEEAQARRNLLYSSHTGEITDVTHQIHYKHTRNSCTCSHCGTGELDEEQFSIFGPQMGLEPEAPPI